MSAPRRPRLAAAALGLFAAAAAAQDDLRDKVVLKNGRELQGRVLTPFAVDEVVLLQGGRRQRLARADVASMDLVGDRIRDFTTRRVRLKDNAKAQWYLVDQAVRAGLPGLARAQAMLLVLDDDSQTEAHEFLGHKKGAKGWLWEHDGHLVTREQLEAASTKKPLDLVGERFRVRADGDLRANVAALLDLERLAVWYFDGFGAPLQLKETLAPMTVATHRSVDGFAKWGFRAVPWYAPPPHGDLARTFFAAPDPSRPRQLFFVGTQTLLYHSLIGEVAKDDPRDRVCPWLEIGFGVLADSTLQGPAGFASPGAPQLQDLQALQALGREYRLTHLLHLPMYGGFYLLDDTQTAVSWSAAATLVAWLLEPDNKPATREPFLLFVRTALGERTGDSSSAFDRTMGRRIEDLEAPWRAWLQKKAGF